MNDELSAWILKCCKPPTASEEAKLNNLPFAREFEHFADTNPSQIPPSQPAEIAVASPPESSKSRNRSILEEGAVLHSTPELHHCSDQNSNQVRGEGSGPAKSRKFRVSEAESEDELRAKRARVVADEVIDLSDSDSDSKNRGKGVAELRNGVAQSPPLLEGEASAVLKKMGVYEMWEKLRGMLPPSDDESDDVDFIKAAKEKGLVFPRPRWWPPPGEDDENYPVMI